ncbi:MAG: glycoside hydrolase family 3 C-terminal domain-containing protein [Ruminococcus sp.]|jgi:beta-glucosidase|nr:glycoside hydrolase family 3 C-terminal domain-containing protein [Ruminococcus sp.]
MDPQIIAENLTLKLTLKEKLRMLTGYSRGTERLGLRDFATGVEIARGYVSHGEGGKPVDYSTVFPQPIGLASTFDKELMRSLGEICAEELRFYWQREKNERGCKLFAFGPTVDPLRDPRWGRNEEAYGEDPCLSGEMSKEYTIGLGGDSEYLKVSPTLKHFCADNNEQNRATDNANADMRLLNEYYYAPFRKCFEKGKARGVMAAYNELSGVPAVMSPDLQKRVKDEWGADYIVTDGGDFSQNYLSHKNVSSHAEAFALCVKNGTDIMLDNEEMVQTAAAEALRQGFITEDDIDNAVFNQLLGRAKLGEFDPECPYDTQKFDVDTDAFKKINLRAAKEQVCLLKNDGILPIKSAKKKSPKIAVIGPLADEMYPDWYTGTPSYNYTIKDGFIKEYGAKNVIFDNGYDHVKIVSATSGKPLKATADGVTAGKKSDFSIFEMHDWDFGSINFKDLATKKYISDNEDVYKATADCCYDWFIRQWFKPSVSEGKYTFKSWHDDRIAIEKGKLVNSKDPHSPDRFFEIEVIDDGAVRAAKAAAEADIVFVCTGNHPMQVARECYDRPTLNLPAHQSKLIKAVFEANPKTVLVIVSSYPYAVNFEAQNLPGIIYTSHAGAELGTAIAQTASGKNNPAACVAQTWYKSVDDLPSIKDYDILKNQTTNWFFKGEALYPFGYGLSYSKFECKKFNVKYKNNTVISTVEIKNVSDIDGEEIIKLFTTSIDEKIPEKYIYPIQKLYDFKRVFIKAGETAKFEIVTPVEEFRQWCPETDMMEVFDGEYTCAYIQVSEGVKTEAKVKIETGFKRPARDLSRRTTAKMYDEKGKAAVLDFDYNKNDWYVDLGDWGGEIVFKRCAVKDLTGIEIAAAAPNTAQTLTVTVGENKMTAKSTSFKKLSSAECKINPSVSKTDWAYYYIPLKGIDTENAEITISGKGINVYSVQLF